MASSPLSWARFSFLFPLLLSTAAAAQTYDAAGYYVRLDAGYGVARDAGATGAPVTGKVDDVEGSPIIGAGVGYRFNRHFRADLTSSFGGGYKLDGTDGAGNRFDGDIEAWTTLVNLYFDYPVGDWSPYLTAGAGVSRNRTGGLSRSPATLALDGKTVTEFAWQAGAGLGYALSPNWSLDVGYRYVDAGGFSSGDRASDGSTGNTVKGDLRSHVALIGVRYAFWTPPAPVTAQAPVPPPAPVAPPAPHPAPTGRGVPELPVLYRVFFEWNQADITSESARTLQEAASTAKAAPVTRIVTTGHADRSGTDGYNMALSLRRASAVKALLVREGVPEGQISILGRGERENLMPTTDGTREMLNRRVEIVLE